METALVFSASQELAVSAEPEEEGLVFFQGEGNGEFFITCGIKLRVLELVGLKGTVVPSAPVLHPEGKVVDQTSQGTHTVFFGEVDRIELGAKSGSGSVEMKPLVFCSRQYWGLGETVHER